MNKNLPLVSICCTTYNHAQYISQAINSFLCQETDFPYEIIIRDDASTDGTTDIVKSYASKFPSIIVPVLNKENLWKKGVRPMDDCISYARGKYVALCEGDDYWIDIHKLQKQITFLERDGQLILTCHAAKIYNQNNESFEGLYSSNKRFLALKDAILGPPMHTSSLVIRKDKLGGIKYPSLPSGDEALSLHLLKQGNGFYLEDQMSVYRLSNSGTWSTRSNLEKSTITLKLQVWTLFEYPYYINTQLARIARLGREGINSKDLNFKELMILHISTFWVRLNIVPLKSIFVLTRKFLRKIRLKAESLLNINNKN